MAAIGPHGKTPRARSKLKHIPRKQIPKAVADFTWEVPMNTKQDAEAMLTSENNTIRAVLGVNHDTYEFSTETFVNKWLQNPELRAIPDNMNPIFTYGAFYASFPSHRQILQAGEKLHTNLSIFEEANYAAILVKAMYTWKCIPPLYPRHTIYTEWFEYIINLENVWDDPPLDGDEDAEEEHRLKVKVEKSLEIKKVLVRTMYMVNVLKHLVNLRPNKIMTIWDEIYLTEQLCNVLYGLRFICDSRGLRDGKWIDWKTFSLQLSEFIITEDDANAWQSLHPYTNPLGDNNFRVLDSGFLSNALAMISIMMATCRGVDVRLPYLRVNQLMSSSEYYSWPEPTSDISQSLQARKFPMATSEAVVEPSAFGLPSLYTVLTPSPQTAP
jgi:hypothetical protein